VDLNGGIINGSEWCLIPIDYGSALPNYVDRSTTRKGKDTGKPNIRYLEELSEPRPGCNVFVNAGSKAECSGTILPNASFVFGGGVIKLIEVWTALLENNEGKVYPYPSQHDSRLRAPPSTQKTR
jgi:hypothetical protein